MRRAPPVSWVAPSPTRGCRVSTHLHPAPPPVAGRGKRERDLLLAGVEEHGEGVVPHRVAFGVGAEVVAVQEDAEGLGVRLRPVVLAHRLSVGGEPRDVGAPRCRGWARPWNQRRRRKTGMVAPQGDRRRG